MSDARSTNRRRNLRPHITPAVLETRLLDKVCRDPGTGCWLFTGCRMRNGYGLIGDAVGPQLAHRVSYTLFCGPIPDGLQLRHTCDNRACVNPCHLLPGTGRDNMHDAVTRDRHAAGRARRRP